MSIVLDGTSGLAGNVNGTLGATTPNTVVATTGSFSGIVTAPTAVAGTNTTQVATTEFVNTKTSSLTSGWPNFLVYMSGTNPPAPNAGTIPYNTVMYDETSSVSAYVFTVPAGQAGTYQFDCHSNVYNIGTSGYYRVQISTLGSVVNSFNGSQTPAQGASDVFSSASLTIKLAVGDQVYCNFRVPATGTASAGLSYNSFAGVRIR